MDAIKSDHVEVAETLISTQKVWKHVKLELKIAVQLNYILKFMQIDNSLKTFLD